MAAPTSNITWGNIVTGSKSTRKGKIGIYTGVSETSTQVTVNVELWFYSMYSIDDVNNTYTYTDPSGSVSGSKNIDHTVDTGSGWSTSNQTKLYSKSYTYNKGSSASTKTYSGKFTGIESVGVNNVMSVSRSVTVPALSTYTVTYNANGGSGAPSAQSTTTDKNLTLSSTKPTKSGSVFQGWATSSTGSVVYQPGASYTAKTSVTLYAIWSTNTYTVTYNANGGSGAPASQTKTYNVALTLSSTKPTKTNCTFKGWSTSAGGTVVYAAGSSYTANASVTLYAVWETSYKIPRILYFKVFRCDSDGDHTDDGTYLGFELSWQTDLSVTSIEIHWSNANDESGIITLTGSGTSGQHIYISPNGSFDLERTYNLSASVSDSGGTSTPAVATLPGGAFVIDILSEGRGISFGKAAEIADTADFYYATRHRRPITLDNQVSIYAFDINGATKQVLCGNSQTDNTNLGWGNYDSKSGNTNVMGYDIGMYVSNVATPLNYRPYIRRGDTLTKTVKTAGYVTNSGTEVIFFIPFSMPIIGNPTVTIASGNGFILRQNGNYTHGSNAASGNVYVHPNKCSATLSMENGLIVTATFSTTTNVVNNSPIGIHWEGTITFS